MDEDEKHDKTLELTHPWAVVLNNAIQGSFYLILFALCLKACGSI